MSRAIVFALIILLAFGSVGSACWCIAWAGLGFGWWEIQSPDPIGAAMYAGAAAWIAGIGLMRVIRVIWDDRA